MWSSITSNKIHFFENRDSRFLICSFYCIWFASEPLAIATHLHVLICWTRSSKTPLVNNHIDDNGGARKLIGPDQDLQFCVKIVVIHFIDHPFS